MVGKEGEQLVKCHRSRCVLVDFIEDGSELAVREVRPYGSERRADDVGTRVAEEGILIEHTLPTRRARSGDSSEERAQGAASAGSSERREQRAQGAEGVWQARSREQGGERRKQVAIRPRA